MATFIRNDKDFPSLAGVRCGTVDNRLFCRDSRDVQDAVDVPKPLTLENLEVKCAAVAFPK